MYSAHPVPRPAGSYAAQIVNPDDLRTPHIRFVGSNPTCANIAITDWRRGWDSNPRYGETVNRISNPAHSTTLPPLRRDCVEGRE